MRAYAHLGDNYTVVSGMKRILVVDDDDATRRWLTEYLGDLGYETQVAVDGEHATRSAAPLHPDLILLDVRVPTPEGAVRFAAQYRERVPPKGRAPIIAMSAGQDLEAFAQQIGANDVLAKPFDLAALVKALAKYLDEPVARPTAEPAAAAPNAVTDVTPQPETGAA